MEPRPGARRQALRGVSQTGGNRRAERLGSRDGAAQLLRRAAPARPGRWQMTPERWRQIEELYHSAREREPEQREALLAQATAEVRAKVEALLAQDASGGKILDRPAWEAQPSLLGQRGSARLTAGAQIGPYKIEAQLGAGGTGAVYRAVG